jgi:sugar lactone lactonase YvrE
MKILRVQACWLFCALALNARTVHADLLISNTTAGSGTPKVLNFNESTGAFQTTVISGVEELEGLAIGPDKRAYAANNILGSGMVLSANASNGSSPQTYIPPSSSSDYGGPLGITWGPDQNLYVASNAFGGGITGILRNVGGGNSFTTFVAAGSNGLTRPYDILFGPDGNLYVTEGGAFGGVGGNAVKRYNGTTGAAMGTFVLPASGGLNQASGMTFGPDGNLYVASNGSDQVLRYNGTTGAFIDAFVAAGSGGLDRPTDLLFGRDGRLYVLGLVGGSVRRFDGVTGQFQDVFIAAGTADMRYTNFFVLTADVPEPGTIIPTCIAALSIMRRWRSNSVA